MRNQYIKFIRNRLYDNIVPKEAFLVFEIGPGNGEFAEWAWKQDMAYGAFDIDPEIVNKMNSKGFQTGLLDASEVRLPGGLLFCAHVVEHLEGPEKIKAILHNGARQFCFLYPACEVSLKGWFQDYSHRYITTRKRIEMLMEDSGLEVVRSGYYWGCFTNPVLAFIGKLLTLLPLPESVEARIQVCGFTLGVKR